MPSSDTIALWANVGTLIALVLNAVALWLAGRQLVDSRRGASAGSLIALNESFRQAWLQVRDAPDNDRKQHALSDLLNILESACAIYQDRLFVGRVGKLLEEYLCHVFLLIQNSDETLKSIQVMIVTDSTFAHILDFVEKHRKELKGLSLRISPAV